MSAEGIETPSRLVQMINPSSPINNLLITAETDLRPRVRFIKTMPPLSKISPPDNSVVDLTSSYFTSFPEVS